MTDQPLHPAADEELADARASLGWSIPRLNWRGLLEPAAWRALVGIGLGTTVLVWPGPTDRVIAVIAALAFVAFGLIGSFTAARSRSRRTALTSLAVLAVGTYLLASGERSVDVLGFIVGASVIAHAFRDVTTWHRQGTSWSHLMPRLFAVAFGGLLVAFPSQMLGGLATVIAIGWILLFVIVLVATLDESSDLGGFVDATTIVVTWLQERPKSVDERQSLYDKILFEGADARLRVLRFFALMSFASVIATMGIVTDSTAVVIGAMLIAPLMTPLMAMAISLVMGWPNRLARAGIVAAAGIALAISIGLVVGLVLPDIIDVATNSQITSRTNPTVLDLIVAIAAGGAGVRPLAPRRL